MRLYLDDDMASGLLANLLTQAGHDVVIPGGPELEGAEDPVHLAYAIREERALFTGNYDDFHGLHDLIMQAQGHHPGILVVRRDNDPRRDLTPRGIVRALRSFLAAGIALRDQFVILNHWR
jgi:predicted nuclease of predicted toxin-antitoxin system